MLLKLNAGFTCPLTILPGLAARGTPPVVNFINIKRTNFSYKLHFGSFYYLHVTRKKLPKQCLYKKFARITLMKLTPEAKATQSKAFSRYRILLSLSVMNKSFFKVVSLHTF